MLQVAGYKDQSQWATDRRLTVFLEHRGERPKVHDGAYVAPNATLCGDVTVGENTRVMFGVVLTAEGGPVDVGANCVVMENAVVRGTRRHPTSIGDNVVVGPRAHLVGCQVGDNAFLATGATVFNGAVIGEGAEVRVNGTVHLKTALPPETVVPIGWVAVGDPVEVLPPGEHERIWELQEPLDFPGTVFGVERGPAGEMMPEMLRRYTGVLGAHREDAELPER
jgi:carbonic anhydrase/acetyltransferase-like protein (isoleucine patch superfamily)